MKPRGAVIKLHTGDPGPELTDNLAFGDGLPHEVSLVDSDPVVFRMPRVRSRVYITAITTWVVDGDAGAVAIRPVMLHGGDALIVTLYRTPTEPS